MFMIHKMFCISCIFCNCLDFVVANLWARSYWNFYLSS